MRRALTLAFAGLFVLLVSAQAQAQVYTLTAQLSGGNEVPGIASGSGGTATVTVDVPGQKISWVVDVFNLPSGVTQSHIHAGSPGVAGPVIINFPVVVNTSNDFRYTGTAGPADVINRAPQGIGSFEDAVQAILAGQTYVNVHSQINPGGEIRGQLILKQ